MNQIKIRPTSQKVEYAFFVFFLYAVFVQYNDPDLEWWILLYAQCAIMTACAIRKMKETKYFAILIMMLSFFLLWMTVENASQNIQTQTLIETFSEAGGSLVAFFWASFLFYKFKNYQPLRSTSKK